MKTRLLAVAALSPLLALPAVLRAEKAAPAPQVDVNYVSAENFTDFKDSMINTDKGRLYLESEFTKHIRQVAREVLPPHTHLEINFTDINMAGEYEPQRGPQFDDIRIMRAIYPPSMNLNFRLLDADGKVIAKGTRHLTDLNYQTNILPFNDDPLRYDKQLLTDWLRSEFAKKGS